MAWRTSLGEVKLPRTSRDDTRAAACHAATLVIGAGDADGPSKEH